MEEMTEDNVDVEMTPQRILKASKGELEELAKEYDLEVSTKASKDELQLLLLDRLQFLSQTERESLPPSPEGSVPSPGLGVDDFKLRELELSERKLKFEMEKEQREADEKQREREEREREREERREREKYEREREERDREEKRMEREWQREEREREREARLYQTEREDRANAMRFEHELKMRQLEIERRDVRRENDDDESINLSKYQGVPKFSEEAVDEFFGTFERQAESLRWPKARWPVILGSVVTGKAQLVYNTLPPEEVREYDKLKAEILKRYALTPEAYRQQYMKCRKADKQSYKEFASSLKGAQEKWMKSMGAGDEVGTKVVGLELLEKFKRTLPSNIRMYLQERKVEDLFEAATLADNYQLIHEQEYGKKKWGGEAKPSAKAERGESQVAKPESRDRDRQENRGSPTGPPKCYNCGKLGHMARSCWAKNPKSEQKGRISLVVDQGVVDDSVQAERVMCSAVQVVEDSFAPFTSVGEVKVGGESIPVVVLRDTGASLTVVRSGAIPGVEQIFTGKKVKISGVEGKMKEIPLGKVELSTREFVGEAYVGISPRLPVPGVDLLVGNDLAKGRVAVSGPERGAAATISAETLTSVGTRDSPTETESGPSQGRTRSKKGKKVSKNGRGETSHNPTGVEIPEELPFSIGVLTRSARKRLRVSKRSDTFANSSHGDEERDETELSVPEVEGDDINMCPSGVERNGGVSSLVREQQDDSSIADLYAEAEQEVEGDESPGVFLRNGVLMRRSRPLRAPATDSWRLDYQIVVPQRRREGIVELAHNSHLGSHLGFKKTYHRVKKHFFWPGMTKDIRKACSRCVVCQRSGKKGQDVPKVKLKPIPVVEEPFSRVVMDCVGPLPRSKKGHQYLLTIMCMATRYVEAVPLRNITAKTVVEAMIRFFTTFGLPKEVQTDQGTNFMSGVFNQALKDLEIKHVVSSPYHPESQGALERFHHTLKEMLRCYCDGDPRHWPNGVPFVLFAVRDSVQESLGFSPFELIFGHDVRGPLKMMKEKWMNDHGKEENVVAYQSEMKERLRRAVECAREHLGEAKERMKVWYDRKAKDRVYEPGDQVLVLLPSLQNPLMARYTGPFKVRKRVGEVTYVIETPEGRRKTKLCHANMLKRYRASEGVNESLPVSVVVMDEKTEEEKQWEKEVEGKYAEEPLLTNTKCLRDMGEKLQHLGEGERAQLERLLDRYKNLFPDVPRQTQMTQHDLKLVEPGTRPIKQHAYRVDTLKKEVLKKEVQFLLENQLIEPSSSEWSSPCILVKKPDGSWRMCTDYRKVNAVTKSDSYPIPRIDDCIDSVGHARFVTKIDLLKGYYGIPLTEEAKQMSAFVTPEGLYQYRVLPFGLKGAPATFQRMMNDILRGIPNCQAYLDDVVVYSDTWGEHMMLLEDLFKRLNDANLTVNLVKSEFGQATVKYLGFEVGSGKVRTLEEKVEAITKMPRPENRRGVRRFLGMVGYYRKCCKNLAEINLPLTELLQKDKTFRWTEQCQQAFDRLKLLLKSNPILLAPDTKRQFELMVDSSEQTMGAVLMQKGEDGDLHPVAYYSKKFLTYQRNYSTVEKEALGLVSALIHFEVYLRHPAHEVVVHTDHNPLVFLQNTKGKNQRLLRWSLLLQEFPLKIVHVSGKDNVLADTLSRC